MSAEKIELLNKLKFNRYAKGDPKRALLKIMDEVSCRLHRYRKDVWNVTIELLADHLGIIENPWKYSTPDKEYKGPVSKTSNELAEIKPKIPTELIEAYIVAAKTNPWDHLGEIFTEEELAGRKNSLGQCLTPRCIVDMMVKMTLGEKMPKPYSLAKPDFLTLVQLTAEALNFNDKLAKININLQAERARWHTVLGMRPLLVKYEPEPITDLDPCVGTGRFLLGATLMFPKAPLILYGIEIDISLYRACLVNMAMFSNHPYNIICADTLMLSEKCTVGGDVWDLGNRWDPPDMTPYYYHSEPKVSPFKKYMQTWTTKNPELVQSLKAAEKPKTEPEKPIVASVETKPKGS